MVMLWLTRQIDERIPVVYFPALPHPTKHQFKERIEREWDLNVIHSVPIQRDVVGRTGHLEIVETHAFAPGRFACFPIEPELGYEPDGDSVCGKDFYLADLPAPETLGLDCIFIGHRSDDTDTTHGAIPLKDHVADMGDFRYVYPLKDWTESDIWEASAKYGIPQNEARYGGDMSANNDYYPLCLKCLKPSDDLITRCPKTGDDVIVLSEMLNPEGCREMWRSMFVNLV